MREQRLAAEISAAKRERDFYMERVDRAKAQEAKLARRQKVRAIPKLQLSHINTIPLLRIYLVAMRIREPLRLEMRKGQAHWMLLLRVENSRCASCGHMGRNGPK